MKTFLRNLKRMWTIDHGTVHDYIPHRHASLEDRVKVLEDKAEDLRKAVSVRLGGGTWIDPSSRVDLGGPKKDKKKK